LYSIALQNAVKIQDLVKTSPGTVMNGWMFGGENRGKIENSDANLNRFQLRPIRKPRSPISLSASNVAEGDKALQALQWSLNTLASNDINKRLWHASILHTFT
jgi:hypothetical protein